MKFESISSTQPYLNPYLSMFRTFDADLRIRRILIASAIIDIRIIINLIVIFINLKFL